MNLRLPCKTICNTLRWDCLFSQEIIEHILRFADGETLLKCRNVSPGFEAAIKYLDRTNNIWQICYSEDNGDLDSYGVISKLHPHLEGLSHEKNWEIMYESLTFTSHLSSDDEAVINEIRLEKENYHIQDILSHGDSVLVLVKHIENSNIFYKIIIISFENTIIFESHKIYSDMLYVTPIENSSFIRRDAIALRCKYCKLAAVPIKADDGIEGFPKFRENTNFLMVEHLNGDTLWLNNFQNLLSKSNCFHIGRNLKHAEIKVKDSSRLKIFKSFSSLFISFGNTRREFNTFKALKSNVTASISYSGLMVLGTGTGSLYMYHVKNETDLKSLNLESYIWCLDVCSNTIINIDVMESKDQFAVICCSDKDLFRVSLNKNLKIVT